MSLKFSPQIIAKGRKYMLNGRVTPSAHHRNVFFVQGSEARPYRVQINAEKRKITLATCSCEFGTQTGAGWSNCSHVAAVLAMLRDRRGRSTSKSDKNTPRNDGDTSGVVSTTPTPTSPTEANLEADTFDPSKVEWVLTPARLPDLWQAIAEADEVAIDLETTGLDEYATGHDPEWPESARISMAALTLPRKEDDEHTVRSYVLPLSHPEGALRGVWRTVVRELVLKLNEAGLPIINQNLKFDMRWMYPLTGIDLSHLFAWDTQIGAHLLDENQSTRLKEVAPRVFGIDAWDDHDLSTPAASEKVPIFELGLYAARDTYWVWRLTRLQRRVMNVAPDGDPSVWPDSPEQQQDFRLGELAVWCAMPTVATLTGMEQRGLAVDREWIEEHIEEEEGRLRSAFDNLVGRYPMGPDREPSFAPTSLWFREWADRAVEAGDLEVLSMTDRGRPQWNKSVLKRLDSKGSPVAGHLLELRDASKKLEFLRAWLPRITPQGTIHTTYHAGRVVTGRLSSSGPNMQQVTYALRPAFIPRPGFFMADLDLSQIELRVAAHVSGSEPMIEAYQQKQDLHRMLAARLSGVSPDEVTGLARQRAKAGNFGFLYGMGAEGFRTYALDNYDVEFSEDEAVAIRAHFFEQWNGIAAWHARAIERARREGQVVSPIGRVRRLPLIDDPVQGGFEERKAINSPVQGFASDLLQIAASTIAGNIPTLPPVEGAHLVGTVHDSILVEVPEDGWEEVVQECMSRMVNLNPILRNMGCELTVPLGVEASVGTRWGQSDVGELEMF